MIWSPGVTLESLEKEAIQDAFRFYQGNKTVTAQVLGIAVRTLDAKLAKYAKDEEAKKEKANAQIQRTG